MEQQLADRIVQALRERSDPLDAEAIGRTYLKLTNARGPAAATLVRALLARDPRFVEQADGIWGLATEQGDLQSPVLICAPEIPRATERTPWLWRLWARRWPEGGELHSHDGETWSESLQSLLALMDAHPIATTNPGALNRWIGAQERIHALPERTPLMIDLRGWQRLIEPVDAVPAGSVHAHAPIAVARDQSARERIEQMHALMDRVVAAAESRHLHTWAEVAEVPVENEARMRQAAWRTDWTLTREEVAALPEEPGVYRFFAAADELLYVGKAKNLRQRVATYFRPLESERSRRAEFLRQIDRLEVTTTGTELEALISEARQIRDSAPSWNVQVTTAPEPPAAPSGETDLLLLLPRVTEGEYSLFALRGERIASTRLSPSFNSADLRDGLRDFYVENALGGILEEVPAPERTFVRRWMRCVHPGSAVLRLVDFATFAALVSAVEHMVFTPPDSQPLLVREASGPVPEDP